MSAVTGPTAIQEHSSDIAIKVSQPPPLTNQTFAHIRAQAEHASVGSAKLETTAIKQGRDTIKLPIHARVRPFNDDGRLVLNYVRRQLDNAGPQLHEHLPVLPDSLPTKVASRINMLPIRSTSAWDHNNKHSRELDHIMWSREA